MKLKYKERRPENKQGNFFVDESCIDCDVCRWMAPDTFGRVGIKSAVVEQPTEKNGGLPAALRAMASCPVGAIRTAAPEPAARAAAAAAVGFPVPVDAERLPGVHYLGYTARDTFGAAAYLVLRENGRHVMVDTPRYTRALGAAVAAATGGQGPAFLFCTHRDDLTEHARWKARFPNMARVVNRLDLSRVDPVDTRMFERFLEGDGPWALDDDGDDDGDGGGGGDHELVWLPGHTWGSTGMLYTPPGQPEERILFTGDHLAFSGRTGELTAFLRYNRGGQDQQLESLEKLKGLDFRWILPGHGRKYRFRDTESRNMLLDICIKRSTSGRGVDFVEVAS